VEEDPAATKAWTTEYKIPSTVELVTKDGRRFTRHVEYPKGEPENPFSDEDHAAKLRNMASWLGMKQNRINKLNTVLNNLEMIGTVSELTSLLVP
jgi:2-methylcitrate dehydratase PrpD